MEESDELLNCLASKHYVFYFVIMHKYHIWYIINQQQTITFSAF